MGRFHIKYGRILLVSILFICCSGKRNREGILVYLPEKSDLGEWKEMGDPQTAVGEDLFLLINGGAEIYYEYGFKQAVIQSYTGTDDKSINLEMYEMEDPESAYGVYSFKSSGAGEKVDLGQGGMLEDYYLNFWKGNFLVTLIGFDTDEETRAGLMMMAKAIEARISGGGEIPQLSKLFDEANRVVYLEGNLGLFNTYEFHTQNIFGLRKGVIGEYDDYRLFVFPYADENECGEWFGNARDQVKENPRFKNFKKRKNGFSVKDEQDQMVTAISHKNAIFICLGSPYSDAVTILRDAMQRFSELEL